MLADRPGTAHASRWLRSPLGLALRLQRGALIGWTVSLAALGLLYGGLAESVETLLADNEQATAFFPEITAAGLVEGYLATTFSINALLAAAYAVSSVLRARAEEAAGRAEPVLATATSRAAWLGGHVAIALLGSALLLVASGAATAGIRVAATGDPAEFGRLFAAALAYLPAVWVVAAVAVALVGLLPRAAVTAAWGAVAYVVVVQMFARALDWPDWVDDLSPIAWTPSTPIEGWTAGPAVGLAVAAVALLALGFGALRRRDLTTA
jgi:ABC-2 type transport system permease protein